MRVASSPPATRAGSPTGGILSSEWLRPVRQYGEYVLGGATTLSVLFALWAIFFYAPTDALQGNVQRIEYAHVSLAWVAYLAFFIVFVASIMYLWRRDARWDLLARASAEIGVIYTSFCLITGSLWGRTIWGAWWIWDDPRLTTTLILWFIYVAYLFLRSYASGEDRGARAAAVLGIVGFIDVPINYLSISWWRTQHPSPQFPLGGQPQAPAPVVMTLMLALVAFTLLFCFLLLQVYRLHTMQDQVARLRARVETE